MSCMTNKWLTAAWEHGEPRFSTSSLLLPQQSLKPPVRMGRHKMVIQGPSRGSNGETLRRHVGFEAQELARYYSTNSLILTNTFCE